MQLPRDAQVEKAKGFSMPWYLQSSLVLAIMFLSMAAGIPIGFSFILSGIVGLLLFEGASTLFVLPQIVQETGLNLVLITIPLFVFMAEVLSAGGFTKRLYSAFDKLIGRVPGQAALATLGACGSFALVNGSSFVAIATIGRMALPELLQRNYKKSLATGVIAAGGSIGILIPPSLTFIFYGLLTDTSISRLFFAGILPGIILLMFFSIVVIVSSYFQATEVEYKSSTFGEKISALFEIAPILIVATVVLSSIYFGVATPTESAAIGCFVAVLSGFIYRSLSFRAIFEALRATTYTTGFILLLVIGAKVLAFVYAMIGVGDQLSELAASFGRPYLVLAVCFAIMLVLGMLMDGMALLVLVVPVFVPMLASLGFDAVWFGVIFVLFTELGLLTPPVGMNCLMIAQAGKPYGVTVRDSFAGIVPFCLCMLAVVLLLLLFPQLALWLPSRMVGVAPM